MIDPDAIQDGAETDVGGWMLVGPNGEKLALLNVILSRDVAGVADCNDTSIIRREYAQTGTFSALVRYPDRSDRE